MFLGVQVGQVDPNKQNVTHDYISIIQWNKTLCSITYILTVKPFSPIGPGGPLNPFRPCEHKQHLIRNLCIFFS